MARHDLDPNFSALLKLFEIHGVRYLLLGGYAVILNGYDRTTKDIDLWIAIDPKNAEQVAKALIEFGFTASAVPEAIFLSEHTIFRFGRPPTQVELLTTPSGIDFEECWQEHDVHELSGIQIPTISLRHLRQNKAASGRLKDLADLEELPVPEDQ